MLDIIPLKGQFQGVSSSVRISDGTASFDGGVDSGRVATVISDNNRQGLARNQLAWLTNGTVRGGGISPRNGWTNLARIIKSLGIYQSGYMYNPLFGNPYLIVQVSGRIYQIRVDTDNSVVDLSAKFNLTNPALVPQGYMAQGEQFLVIQAGDFTQSVPTLPLFWDGATLRRSIGITNPGVAPGTPNVNQIPAATAMVYYQGRLWYVQGNTVSASDIVKGTSGTLAYNFSDAILNVTENPLSVGGDGFAVSSSAGNITAINYTANLDTSLGQGPLYIFTQRQIYALSVPVTRAAWIAANNNTQPLMTVALIDSGAAGDRCVIHVNGDLFFQSSEPAIRSLFISTRFFTQWGNVPISRPISRALQYSNPNLLGFATGIEFDNRMWQGILPVQTKAGVAFQGIAILDFDIISNFGGESTSQPPAPPAWEGMLEGLDILQLFEGYFGGNQRAFALVHSRVDDFIYVWELTGYLLSDQDASQNNRVNWYFETPAYDFARFFDMKRLDGGELWVDSVAGTVDMIVEYRVDADPCWQIWKTFQFCANATNPNVIFSPNNYPQPTFCEGQKFPLTLPRPFLPPGVTMNLRPNDVGYQFQVRVQVKGQCRIRGILLFSVPVERQPYEGLNPAQNPALPAPAPPPPPPPIVASFLVGHGIPASLTLGNPIFFLDNTVPASPNLWSYDGSVWAALIGSSTGTLGGLIESPQGFMVINGSPAGFVPSAPTLALDNTFPDEPNLWSFDGSVWSLLIGTASGLFTGFTIGTPIPLVGKGSPIAMGLAPAKPVLYLDNTVPGSPSLWSWDGTSWVQLI